MRNVELAADYVRRAAIRLQAVDVFYRAESWADVVRESQEIVELALRALLRSCGAEPPRVHDVGDVLEAERERLPKGVRTSAERLATISKELRRDRELAFYGAEDLTPSTFNSKEDALRALEGARFVVETVPPHELG
jgi:HEPN domain-containing protein